MMYRKIANSRLSWLVADQAANLDTGEAPENSSKRYHQPLPSLNTIAFEKMRFCSCNQFHFFKL